MNKLKKIFFVILLLSFTFQPIFGFAQNNQEGAVADSIPIEQYYRGEVLQVLSTDSRTAGGYEQVEQRVIVKYLSGPKSGEQVEITHGGILAQTNVQLVAEGDKVILVESEGMIGQDVFIAEKYRLPQLGYILIAFVVAVLFFGKWKGLGSLVGLSASILVLVYFIVPQIVSGSDPLLISIIGSLGVATISIYLAHGINKSTSIALFSTILTLCISGALAILFVNFSQLLGFGSEEAFYVQVLGGNAINLKGLLLGGIMIGSLGVLDDITTSQAATVRELKLANSSLGRKELQKRALRVGAEHISSLVNTLVFAYAGASFPLLVLFTLNTHIPVWVTLNSELIAEELVRTLVGSIALILAVPITTFLAAYFFAKTKPANSETKQG